MIQKIYFEASSRCNLNCKMCFRNAWINEETGDMDPAYLSKVLHDEKVMKNVHTVFFGGMGEPLSHPDILSMVGEASKRVAHVELITNGTLLTEEMSHKLLEAGLTKLWVSMDGFEESFYESIRKGSHYTEIYRNLFSFNRMRKGGNPDIMELGIAFVVMKSNLSQLMIINRFVNLFLVNDINISNILPGTPEDADEALYTKLLQTSFADPLFLPPFPRYRIPLMDYDEPGVTEAYLNLMRQSGRLELINGPFHRKTRFCRFIAEGNVFVRWDGDVSPCMGLLHSAVTYLHRAPRTVLHHSFGNLAASSLSEIWDSPEYSNFRSRVLDFQFSPCIGCGGCEQRETNQSDCLGNDSPTCGACLWSEGLITCP